MVHLPVHRMDIQVIQVIRKIRVKPVTPVVPNKKENPAPLVLPKEIGLLDHYGRKEANCVEDAPKAG